MAKAGAGTLTSLDLVVRAKITDLEKGLKQAEDKLKKFGDNTNSIVKIAIGTALGGGILSLVTGAMTAAATAIQKSIGLVKDGISKAIEFGINQWKLLDERIELGDALGVGINSMEQLRIAAKTAGVEFGSIEKAFVKINSLAEEGADKDSPAAKVLDRLGLSSMRLKALKPDEQIRAIVAAINALPKSEQLAATIDVFGGKEGLKMLKLTSEHLDAAGEKAKRWGLTITDTTAEAVRRIGDHLDDLMFMLEGLGRSVFVSFVPHIEKAMDWLKQSIDGIGIKNLAQEIVKWIEWAANKVISAIESMANSIGIAMNPMLTAQKALLMAEAGTAKHWTDQPIQNPFTETEEAFHKRLKDWEAKTNAEKERIDREIQRIEERIQKSGKMVLPRVSLALPMTGGAVASVANAASLKASGKDGFPNMEKLMDKMVAPAVGAVAKAAHLAALDAQINKKAPESFSIADTPFAKRGSAEAANLISSINKQAKEAEMRAAEKRHKENIDQLKGIRADLAKDKKQVATF